MRKISYLAAVAALSFSLVSCSQDHKVRLSNGAIITAVDNEGREYQKGAQVCARKLHFGSQEWKIDNDGNMIDTTYLTKGGNVLEYVTGRIL